MGFLDQLGAQSVENHSVHRSFNEKAISKHVDMVMLDRHFLSLENREVDVSFLNRRYTSFEVSYYFCIVGLKTSDYARQKH